MRYCLINLTRLGDLLQTQTVIQALKAQGHQVGLVCLDNFAQAASLLQGLDHLAVLPGSLLLRELDQDWRLCAAKLQAWVEEQEEVFPAEQVLNLTPSLGARLLANLLGQGRALGFALDDHGFGANSSSWATYVQAASKQRGSSPFNLVDGFRKMAGVGAISPVYELRKPESALVDAQLNLLVKKAEELGLSHKNGFIAFQLGASNAKRQWPVEYFAALGQAVQGDGQLCPVLLGSAAERSLAAAYLAQSSAPAIDLTGRTDLPALAATLLGCKLLVTNDTGTMHLAAGLGVPCLAVFLATAQAWDTGPYQEDMCCLEPDLACHPCDFGQTCAESEKCRHFIQPELLQTLIQAWLESGRWQDAPQPVKQARIWKTCLDDCLFMNLEALSDEENSDRTIWIRHQRRFYRRFLDNLDQNPAPDCESSAALAPLSAERSARIGQTLDSAAGLLLLIRERAALLEMRPTDQARKAFLTSCERMDSLLRDSPDFVPLYHLWRDSVQSLAEDWPKLLNFFEKLRESLLSLKQEIAVAK